jgi:DUF4097 and DUF4098 domain-containing protein YvlB
MPTFDTPQPILVTIDLLIGDARIVAGERADTVVQVRPRDPSHELDVKAASQVTVDYRDGKLIVKTPKSLQTYFSRRFGTVEVTVELPAGSHVRGNTSMGEFHCEGELGECYFKTATGDISVHRAGKIHLSTPAGNVTVDRAAGDTHIDGSGEIRIREIRGTASIKNLNGDSWVGEAVGDISLNSAHGAIYIDRAHADVAARTAFGSIRIGEVSRGKVVMQSALGELEIGIREGTAAWLDVKSSVGRVRSTMEPTDGPEPARQTVEVRGRTHGGDIIIRRVTKETAA